MIIGRIFAEELKKLGIFKLHVGYEKPSLQQLAIKMLVKNYGIKEKETEGQKVTEEEGISLYKGKEGERVSHVFTKGGSKIPLLLPKYPLFVIDMGLYNELSDEEKKKTLLQINVTLNVIRKYLWDGNLAVIHFSQPIGNVKLIDNIDTTNCVVLDPYGDVLASEEILRNTDVFILGGVVDKGRRLKYATKKLTEMYNYPCKRVKIALRGSVVGVPDEINKIVEIVLKVVVGEKLEDAIIESQSKSDKIARVLVDVNNYGAKILDEEIKWLRVDEKTYKLILARLKLT